MRPASRPAETSGSQRQRRHYSCKPRSLHVQRSNRQPLPHLDHCPTPCPQLKRKLSKLKEKAVQRSNWPGRGGGKGGATLQDVLPEVRQRGGAPCRGRHVEAWPLVESTGGGQANV